MSHQLIACRHLVREGTHSNFIFTFGYQKIVWKITILIYKQKLHFFLPLQEYNANTDYSSVVVSTLDEPIIARYIRIHPIAWYSHISMRFEMYGCYSGEGSLGTITLR